ncbi:MAG TPA: Bax inhibitor-1/YccA family protein [bacterium]|nr:Bax inhibitor-1/YccA family protein [bacterium]
MSDDLQKSGSPVLGGRFLKEKAAEGEATFTSHGAVNKTGVLALILVLGGALTWGDSAQFMPLMLPLVLGAFVLAMIVSFVPSTAMFLAPLYALLEGMALGALSSVYEGFYHGIVFQAALGTSLVLLVMIVGYATGLFRFGQRGRAVIWAATMGIMLVYVVDMVLGMFGHSVGMIQSNGPLGILFSVAVLVVAALNLSLNFEFISRAQEEGLSKRMEWYAGFGVLVTLVWIYLEMLRLLSKLNRK